MYLLRTQFRLLVPRLNHLALTPHRKISCRTEIHKCGVATNTSYDMHNILLLWYSGNKGLQHIQPFCDS
jgi:hypothetical protein